MSSHQGDDIPDDDESYYSDEDEDLSSSEEEEVETGLTENQGRLLYLISLYTRPARSGAEKEEWIRKQALLVLVYEAIVAQVLDYDYAPQSELVGRRRKYFNISQEGKSDIDFLREEELLNGLKLSSKDYQPVTCFQISEKGLEIAKRLPKSDKEAVHDVVYAPGTRDLLRVEWRDEEYWLITSNGFERLSTVTDCEDVSYVSSAYVPQCLRYGGRPTLSNAHRAHECGVSSSNIRDELDEVITLNSVSIIVGEFIPFGANQVVQLNQNLGSTERVQGGFFTALVDENSSGTKFEVEPGLTSVNILDYTLTKHVNFEADIHLPEAEGVVQVETFGVSMNADGTIFYGMQIEAVMDRIKDNISLDHLSRLLVDVHIDSSTIVDSVISGYQRQLLELIFYGDAENRDKVNLLIANEITPHLTAEEYMDKGEYENELKQVLGDTRAAFDISEHDTLIFGAHGILVAGPNSRHHEPLLCSYLQFNSMDIFVRNFFNRMFMVLDEMKETRRLIDISDTNPNSIQLIRAKMAEISKDIIMLEEILGYLAEALETCEIPPEPADQSGRALYERLQIADLAGQLSRRVIDLRKNMAGARHEMEVLREMSNIVSETKMFQLTEGVQVNTRNLCQLQEANERASASLEIMQVVLAGSLAFDILDRFTGEWSLVENIDDAPWMDFGNALVFQVPMFWFFFSILFWVVLGLGLIKFMRFLSYQAAGTIALRMRVNARVNLMKLNQYLATKNLGTEDRSFDGINHLLKLTWEETDKKMWGGTVPEMSVEYDEKTSYMLFFTVVYNKREAKRKLALNAYELKTKVAKELDEAGIFEDGYSMEEAVSSDVATPESKKVTAAEDDE
jgi:WD repeat-containing protein 35